MSRCCKFLRWLNTPSSSWFILLRLKRRLVKFVKWLNVFFVNRSIPFQLRSSFSSFCMLENHSGLMSIKTLSCKSKSVMLSKPSKTVEGICLKKLLTILSVSSCLSWLRSAWLILLSVIQYEKASFFKLQNLGKIRISKDENMQFEVSQDKTRNHSLN